MSQEREKEGLGTFESNRDDCENLLLRVGNTEQVLYQGEARVLRAGRLLCLRI